MLINSNEIKKVTVLGLGISGKAAVELAAKHGFSVTAIDEKEGTDLIWDINDSNLNRITVRTGFKESTLPNSDLIVISPGISNTSKLGRLASGSGVPIISELDFASRFATSPIVAITGTNGKTTVTEMTEMILDNAISAGNIGHPLSLAVEDTSKECLVVECSSFQLEKSPSFSPTTAAILNITSDHLDRYANFAEYRKAKFNIFRNIANCADMIINYNLLCDWQKWAKEVRIPSDQRPLTFSATESEADITCNGSTVSLKAIGLGDIDISEAEIHGNHNIENFMAAAALASRIIDADFLNDRINLLLRTFRPSPHRQEIIAEKNGIIYVNDSKSTNPDSVISALKRFGKEKNICLIAGGLNKEMNFSDIKKEAGKIKNTFLIGETKNMLQNLWEPEIHCKICKSLEDAVRKSENSASKGDIILLSPGCASMDMFKNYKERGESFCKIIHQSGN